MARVREVTGAGAALDDVGAHYPQLRLDRDALDHNIATMASWCASYGVDLWPHVKTTMSRPVVERQRAAGASGVTVATVDQAVVVHSWGEQSILLANEVVDRSGLARLRSLLEDDPALRLTCLVDSVDGVDAALAHGPTTLRVMVDVGTYGGRSGVRTTAAARLVAEHAARSPGVELVGVAGYEGVVRNRRDDETIAAVDRHCALVRESFVDLQDLYATDRPVFTMGGSAFPDRVVALPAVHEDVPGAVTVLRSGCYVTHDHGAYAAVSPIPGLVPALSVRAVVVSAPEPGLVVVGAGKRELPHDAGAPTLLGAWSPVGETTPAAGSVRAMFDHHTTLEQADGLAVGDVVELGISHPCSAFSRWDRYDVVAGGRVVEQWTTRFRPD